MNEFRLVSHLSVRLWIGHFDCILQGEMLRPSANFRYAQCYLLSSHSAAIRRTYIFFFFRRKPCIVQYVLPAQGRILLYSS